MIIIDKIYFAKVKPNAIIPSKRKEDMAYDVYACFDEDFILIKPGETVLIPTGIASAFSDRYGLSLRERGSSGVKSMAVRAGQIDSGFRNEIFVAINNTSDRAIYISRNDEAVIEHMRSLCGNLNISQSALDEIMLKNVTIYPTDKAICQGKLELVPDVDVVEIPYEELKEIPSERGMGMLGSSKK